MKYHESGREFQALDDAEKERRKEVYKDVNGMLEAIIEMHDNNKTADLQVLSEFELQRCMDQGRNADDSLIGDWYMGNDSASPSSSVNETEGI